MAAPFGQGWHERYGDQEISQFRGAQLICEKWGLTRRQLEEFALESHARAMRAIDEGRFDREITPLAGVTADEGPRRDTTLEEMAGLKPLREGWEVTAATASQISDGAAALLIASPTAVRTARVHPAGPDPLPGRDRRRPGLHADRPDPRHRARAGARATSAWTTSTSSRSTRRSRPSCWPGRPTPAPRWRRRTPTAARSRSGHPLGATGAILMTKLLHELERSGGRYGLQTMCEGGGQANATIIERLT